MGFSYRHLLLQIKSRRGQFRTPTYILQFRSHHQKTMIIANHNFVDYFIPCHGGLPVPQK